MPLPRDETTPPVTKTYFVGCSVTRCLPEAVERREGPASRSISAPSERRSPRRVRPASAPIASQRLRPVSRSTELKPSMAPSAFDPASPSIAISRRS